MLLLFTLLPLLHFLSSQGFLNLVAFAVVSLNLGLWSGFVTLGNKGNVCGAGPGWSLQKRLSPVAVQRKKLTTEGEGTIFNNPHLLFVNVSFDGNTINI